MTRAHHFALTLALAFCASIVSAQVPTGTPPFSSVGGGPDIIDLANLNSHIDVPVVSKSGRGTNFTYALGYDTSVWYPVGISGSQSWRPVYNWGWLAETQVATGYISYGESVVAARCTNSNGQVIIGTRGAIGHIVYNDPYGSPHLFPGGIQFVSPPCSPTSGGSLTNVLATDGSGYKLSMTADDNGNITSHLVVSRTGTQLIPPLLQGAGSGNFTDRNGNEITVSSSGVFTDTLGTTALTVTGTGTPTSPMTFTYSYPVGPAAITAKYTAFTVQTKFGCTGIAEYGPISNNLVSEIDLPDGSKYSFTYEGTPGVSGNVTGRLASVQLPTGGTITYAYTGGSNGITCADGSAATLTRTTPDGTWKYAQVKGTAPASTTTVTDPQSNVTTIQFQGIYETQRVVNQGSTTALKTTNTCYNGATSPCTGTAITLPITQRTAIITLPNNLQCKHVESFSTFGMPTETDDYDYGSGAPSSTPLRKILITYASLGSNINAFSQTTTVQNGAGTQIAQTTNNYDETTPTVTSGLPQHVAVSGSRGNLTSVNQWLNTTNANLTSHMTYYDTGMRSTSTDFNGHATTNTYSSAFAGAYPTTIANALNQSTTINYDPSGVVTSVKDPNNQTTSYTYDGLLRLIQENFPDGGQTAINFNTSTNITAVSKMNSSQSISNNTELDGLSRTKQTQLQSDPQGTDFTDTTYDSLGRVSTISNPYRSTSDPTYGITTIAYDALNRPTSITNPDGSVATASYSNNITTVTDEAGKKRQFQTDALGRITQVIEDPSGLGFVTTYGFDALGNLISVVQGSNQRTYSFDSLSRMASENNPESGIVNYKYDADSNCGNSAAGLLASKTNARGVRTCFFYDALNRLTKKSYSDGTLAANYVYDQTANWIPLSNTIGRMTEAYTQSSILVGTIFSYDSMGRVTQNNQVTPIEAPSGGAPLAYSYDLAGNVTQMTYPSGRVVQQSFDSAGRLCAVAASTSNCSTFTSPYATAFTYDPASQVTGFNYGNGVAATFGYSNRLQNTSLKYTSGTTTLFNLSHAFGAAGSNNGQISGVTDNVDNGRSVVYGYDSLNRLSSALTTGSTNYPQWGLSWNYDRNGNRTAQTVTAGTGPSNSVSVNASTNQINTSGYSYDLGGNMTNDASNTLVYDAENRVTSATNGGASGSYVYNAAGLRVEKVSGGATTDSIYLGPQVIAQYGGGQGLLAEYVFAGSQQLAVLAPTTIQNPSFETTNPLGQNCGTGCNFNQGPIPGWTLVGQGGSWQPNSTYYNLPLPNGSIVGYSNGGTISQTLQAALQPNSTYTLSVYIGHRLDGDVASYSISLQAGSTVLNTVSGSNSTIPAGAFAKVTLTYSTGATVTPGDLSIVLTSGGSQIDFDNVQLTGADSPLYFHPDHLSTRLMTDASGNLAGQQGHFPFGEAWYAQNTTNKWQFTSYEHDSESGNDYAIARSYVNRLARFSSPDPAGLAAVDPTNPQSWNRYAYVKNNPLNSIDSLGMSDCPDLKYTCGDVGGDLNGAPGVDLFGSVNFGTGNPANGCDMADITNCADQQSNREIAADIAAENRFASTAAEALFASMNDYTLSKNGQDPTSFVYPARSGGGGLQVFIIGGCLAFVDGFGNSYSWGCQGGDWITVGQLANAWENLNNAILSARLNVGKSANDLYIQNLAAQVNYQTSHPIGVCGALTIITVESMVFFPPGNKLVEVFPFGIGAAGAAYGLTDPNCE